VNIQSLNAEPAHLEGLCKELAMQLCEKYLNQHLRTSKSLTERQKIKDQLAALCHKRSFRERPMDIRG
jgi:hypothetical protein